MWTRVTAGRVRQEGQKAGSMGRQRKARTSRLIGNHTFCGAKTLGGRQRKVEEGTNLQYPNVTCCSLCPHYNKIIMKLAMQIRSTQQILMPLHF